MPVLILVILAALLAPAARAADPSPALRQDGANLYASLHPPALLAAGLEPELRAWVAEAFAGCPAADWILTDLRRLNFSSRQRETAAGRRTDWLIEFDGLWDWTGVQECLTPRGHQLETYRGVPLLVPGARHPSASAAAHWQGEFLLLGDAALVRSAIDRALDGAPDPDPLALQAASLSTRYDVWLTGLGSPLDYVRGASKETRDLAPAPRQYWLGLTAGSAFSLDLAIQMMTPEEAALVLKLLAALPTLTKLHAPERGLQSEVYRFSGLRRDHSTVHMQATLPAFALWHALRDFTASGKAARFGALSRPATRKPSLPQ
jgi:hypothetical protein